MASWLDRIKIFFCRHRDSSLPAECFIDLLLEWANNNYDIVILECRPGIETKIITRVSGEYTTILKLNQELTDSFFRDMETTFESKQITDYMCSTKTAVMMVDDVAITVEISVLPVAPAGSDIGIHITNIH